MIKVKRSSTILGSLPALTAEERARMQDEDRRWPDRIVAGMTVQQRRQARDALRRKRAPVDARQVIKFAEQQRRVRKHGYLKRTANRFDISISRVQQIIRKTR